ncbi:hypothetical protein KAFR_0A00300 [Kazachstania africana CBS 2517]|uniref:Uncharacterized protein n=1 Tax=Kazachstania africana (strain ATCC 22294 / BCRC 22015 / CBS 2517 / CECT 1963 / NBRC 1671 / NRRL Y-8276) TaxID=1071382 RepID=H2AM68_KAZAF|nr:hypothetical protein KAFR_0A00300 [Kazachstania africana CBS 2517]CCF55468.1 hypothetical protein KAFR_0A00300 [Kazachstania africana CBS 2517]
MLLRHVANRGFCKTSSLIPRTVSRIVVYRHYRRKGGSNTKLLEHVPGIATSSGIGKNEILLAGKSKEEIESGLKKIGFENTDQPSDSAQDFFLRYLKHTNVVFKSSSKNLNHLKEELKQLSDDSEKFEVLIQYLLRESELEIKRYKLLGKDKIIQKKLDSLAAEHEKHSGSISEQTLETVVFNNLFLDTQEETDIYFTNINLILKILQDLCKNIPRNTMARYKSVVPISLLVELFEMFKLVPLRKKRKLGILLAGKLIYASKKVRMDPVNESFYINSLVAYGFYKDALKLFQSYKLEVNQRWWNELGMLIMLASNNLRGFSNLLKETDIKFPSSGHYLNIRVLKFAIKKYIFINNTDVLGSLVGRLLKICDHYGVIAPKEGTSRGIMFKTQEEANMYLNDMELPNEKHFTDIIQYFIHARDLDMIGKLFAKFIEYFSDEKSYLSAILSTKINLLKDFTELKALIASNNISSGKLQLFEEAFNRIISRYDCNDSLTNELLFDNLNSFIYNPLLTKTIENVLTCELTSQLDENTNSTDLLLQNSKNIVGLLKVLLSLNKESEAFNVLDILESKRNTFTQKVALPSNATINAHHYGVFLDHYTAKCKKTANKRTIDDYNSKVRRLLTKMNNNKVKFNSIFLSKVLRFYRSTKNLNECFRIINDLLTSKENDINVDNNELFYDRRGVTRLLYLEIWKIYYDYSILHYPDVVQKSNSPNWRRNRIKSISTLKIRPQYDLVWLLKLMINEDSILLDSRFYHLIASCFMKARNFEVVPCVLSLMFNNHDLKMNYHLLRFISVGIKNEFIISGMDRVLNEGDDMKEANSFATSEYYKRKEAGEFFTSGFENFQDPLKEIIKQILNLLKFKNPYDVNYTRVRTYYEQFEIDPSYFMNIVNNM